MTQRWGSLIIATAFLVGVSGLWLGFSAPPSGSPPMGQTVPPEKEKPVPKAPIIAPPAPQLEEGLPTGEFFAVAFRPDGRFLAAGVRWSARFGAFEQRSVDILDARNGNIFAYYLPNRFYEGIPVALAFSPDGRFLAVGGLDARVYLWDTKTAQLQRVLNFMAPPGPVTAVAFSPDGKRLAVGGQDGRLRLFERVGDDWTKPRLILSRQIVKGELVEETPRLPSVGPTMSPQERERLKRLLDTLRMKNLPSVRAAVFDPKGRWLAVAGTGVVVGVRGNEGILVFSFASKLNLLAVLQGHGKDVTWRLQVGTQKKPPVPWVNDLAVSRDGRYLVSAGWDGTVRVWDTNSFRMLRKLESPKTPTGRVATRIYNACAISPDNRYVAAGGFGHRVDIWELATGRLVTSLRTENIVEAVAFSPNGRMLVAGGWDGLLRAWQVGTWRLLWQQTHTFIEASPFGGRGLPRPKPLP